MTDTQHRLYDHHRDALINDLTARAERLERLAAEIKLRIDTLPGGKLARREASYVGVTALVLGDVTWGVANMGLDTIIRNAGHLDTLRAELPTAEGGFEEIRDQPVCKHKVINCSRCAPDTPQVEQAISTDVRQAVIRSLTDNEIEAALRLRAELPTADDDSDPASTGPSYGAGPGEGR